MPKPSEILTPGTWIKDSYGVFSDGEECLTSSLSTLKEQAPRFVKFCMLGACVQCGIPEPDAIHKLRKIIMEYFPDRVSGYMTVGKWNDHPKTTLEEVLFVLRKAEL